jgi:uncharacterized membrane protein
MNPAPISITPVLPLWIMILLFCLCCALALAQYGATRKTLDRTRAFTLSFLRLLALSLILAFALNPCLVTKEEHWISPAIAVVVDTSQSMGQTAPGENVTRLDEAKAFLRGGIPPLLEAMKEKFEVSVYGLADSLRPLDAGDLDLLKAGGGKGDVKEALETLRWKNAVAVFLSDGNLRWNESGEPPFPVITVPMGNPKEYRDILIGGVKAPALAFRDREVIIDVTIRSYGYSGSTVPVLLKDSERLLTAREISIQDDTGEVTVSLSFTPSEVGRKNLSIAVPPQVGESIVGNNEINLSIHVIRDKTRILMVSGTPSMNYRFMRTALKDDPSVDLLSFVILRSPSDILNVPTHEQSLIPFPVETLFSKELTNFDLVIFDNFNYPLFLTPDHLESLRAFVKGGGGFALIGGPHVFHEGRDGLSLMADLLPFRFVEKESYRRDSPVRVRLSQEGAEHPLMRLSDDLAESDTDSFLFWQDMPPLDGINPVEAKRSSVVLLESGSGIPWPILILSDYGKGRVLALATDCSWQWDMGMVARGKGNQAYLRLVHRMVRWLTRDPDLDAVQVLLPEKGASAGQETDVRIQFHGKDWTKGADPAGLFSVFNPGGASIESKLKPAASHPGEYLLSFLPKEGGIYRIKVETPVGHLEEPMVVAGPFESFDAAPDHDQLKKIAAFTGGRYLPKGDDLLKAIEAYAQKKERRFIEEKRLPMWATPLVMAIVLGLLSSEWYLRRRWGLT